MRTRQAGEHCSLIASLGSSPPKELFHACVSDGSCAYQVSVPSEVGIDRPMMVSEVPASECQLHRQQMPCQETATAAVKKGAHRLLQNPTRTLNGTLLDLFTAWYPAMPANDVQTALYDA